MNKSRIVLVIVLTAVLAVAAWLVLRPEPSAPQPAPGPVTLPVSPPASIASTPVPSTDPPAPAIQHPVQAIEVPPGPRPLPALGASDARMQEEASALVGARQVQKFLLLESFVRRLVVTVDNLGREHAAPSMWPVQATPGRFTTRRQDGHEVIDPDNAQRYTPLVQFIESVDSRRAVQVYASLYPLFQQAYQELGYPKAYFNDRLVAVVDQMLAAPVREGPLPVSLVEVKGPIAPERPWTRYEFVDDDLQDLSAGQKIMVRVGASNQRRLRAKLLELRKLLTRAALPVSVY